MATNIVMPKLGESVIEGTVTKWLKQEGEQVQEMDALVEINTDKVDTEIPSPAGGTLLKILVPEGATVSAGTLLAVIGSPGEAPDNVHSLAENTQVTISSEADAATRPVAVESHSRQLGFISPVVAKLAHENNLDLSQVKGSGEGGRITKKDVLAYLEARSVLKPEPEPAAWETPGDGELFRPPEIQFAGGIPGKLNLAQPVSRSQGQPAAGPALASTLPGDVLKPFSSTRKIIAERMSTSKHSSPHVTTVMEADLKLVVVHREANKAAFERDGVHLTFSAYFVAACAAALKTFPDVNSSWSEQGLLLHRAINIGLAVSLGEESLIVPVIKGADGLSMLGIARAINDLAERARSLRLQPDEVRGSTFTITNHGASGSLFATPIINQPNCAILGVGIIQKRPVVIDDAIAIRPMVYLGLTFDHRILDGAIADGFLSKVVEVLENWI
jgi:pyruvate/2-oxoglutarate dehydrogenase complex dihydrolipoamide acyltransferase (E2) component